MVMVVVVGKSRHGALTDFGDAPQPHSKETTKGTTSLRALRQSRNPVAQECKSDQVKSDMPEN
jgi:hypothetical protein